jgi:hypothetical protein
MAKHRLGGPTAQQLDVVDAVGTRDHGVHQREQLAPWAGCARPVPQIEQLVGGRLDPQPLREGGRQQQPGAGHRPLVVEATSTWSSTTYEDPIEKVSSGSGVMTAWQPPFSLVRGPFYGQVATRALPGQWIQAQS